MHKLMHNTGYFPIKVIQIKYGRKYGSGFSIFCGRCRLRQAWCPLHVKLCDPRLSAVKWFVNHAGRYTSALLCFTFNSHSIRIRLNNTCNIRYLAEYFKSLFGTALVVFSCQST